MEMFNGISNSELGIDEDSITAEAVVSGGQIFIASSIQLLREQRLALRLAIDKERLLASIGVVGTTEHTVDI